MDYGLLAEELYIHFSSKDHYEKCLAARKEFFEFFYGGLKKEGSFLEELSSHFVFWYLFEKKENGRTLLKKILDGDTDFVVQKSMIPFLKKALHLRRSLFCLRKVKRKRPHIFILWDLVKGEKVKVFSLMDLSLCGDIFFDAYTLKDDVLKVDCMVQVNLFHPEKSTNFLKSEIKTFQKRMKSSKVSDAKKALAQIDLLTRFSKMYYKFYQYRNLDVNLIYSEDSVLNRKIEKQTLNLPRKAKQVS